MNKIVSLFFLSSLFLFSCQSSRSLLTKGRYDEAIEKSVHKLKKNENNQKEILVLEEAYRIVMEKDSSRIIFLKKEGRPENWQEVYEVYARMKQRQDLVRTLPKLNVTDKNKKVIRSVEFNFKSFDEEIIQAKQKAAEFDYVTALAIMAKGGRHNGRTAYAQLDRVKRLIPNFRDVDDQMNKAREQGTSYVLFKVRNESRSVIPKDLEEDLLKLSPSDINEKWIHYYSAETKGIDYDFFVFVNIKNIDVSPERVKESSFEEIRDIQDGWNYVKDARGNVMKDSLGNDIKVPRIVTVACRVFETQQLKTARVVANLDFVDARNNSLVKSFPLIADTRFENYALVPVGNIDALKPETRKRLGGDPLPFPGDENMIYKAGLRLKDMAKDIVRNNDDLLQ